MTVSNIPEYASSDYYTLLDNHYTVDSDSIRID